LTTLRGLGRASPPALSAGALVAACSGPAASPAASAATGADGITVTGAWVRNSTAMTGALAGYFVVTNKGSQADTLLSASSPIAKTVQLHETKTVDASAPAASAGMSQMPGMSGMPDQSAMPGVSMPAASGMPMASSMPMASGMGGMMTMVEVKSVDIPAGGSLEFKPGSYHVMFMDLVSTPAAGTTIDLTLTFKNAGTITVKAEVRAQ
jgi:periplasmic copper chaperone A